MKVFIGILLVFFGGMQPLQASISTSYAPASQLSPSNREVNKALKEKRILERVAEDFNRLYDIPNIHIKTVECRQSNAFYSPNTRTIELCLELVEDSYQRAKIVSNKPSERALLVGGAINLVLAHEMGHAMAHIFKLPITGKEEDFADQLSLFTILHEKGGQYSLSAATLVHNGNDQDLADVHSLDTQRRIGIICWAWGADSKKFGFVAGRIPKYRKETCKYEFQQMNYAIKQLLGNHLKIF